MCHNTSFYDYQIDEPLLYCFYFYDCASWKTWGFLYLNVEKSLGKKVDSFSKMHHGKLELGSILDAADQHNIVLLGL